MSKMGSLYWSYETSIGSAINVSIRSLGACDVKDYESYLSKFINKYKKRIIGQSQTSKFIDGSYCTIINLSPGDMLEFNGKN